MEAQQKLELRIAETVSEEVEETGQIDLEKLLIANRKLERAQVDFAWLNVLLKSNFRAKDILRIWEKKDENSREADGRNG